MRVLDRMERDLVVGAGDEPEGDTVDYGTAWMDDILLGIIGAGCGALATGFGGGAYCSTVTTTLGQVLEASPDIDLGSAYSCAKIGTGCDAVSSD